MGCDTSSNLSLSHHKLFMPSVDVFTALHPLCDGLQSCLLRISQSTRFQISQRKKSK